MSQDVAQIDEELLPSRYVVGIDLGTTNSAVCYVDTHQQPWRIEVLEIPQLVDAGVVESRDTLPSFHYQPGAGEVSAGALRLPWQSADPNYVVGFMARDWGTRTAGRLISSAKSWLCHAGVDRTANLLPWQGAEDVDRLSPIQVSSRYLGHIRAAWDHRHPDSPLADQDIVVTLPASFDEVARELTIQAAALAGLKRVMLIEEPQAAFYAWIYKHADNWEQFVTPGQKILICDIGGGTSDFTLIRVRRTPDGQIQFHRVAVGEHLILGGDNLDLALARHLEQKLHPTEPITARQWDVLLRASRVAKERLLSEGDADSWTVHVPATGSRLLAGSLQVSVDRSEVQQLLVEGFFPRVALDARPQRHASGFREFGLPYAADPGITRYLATFLTAHRHAGDDGPEPSTSQSGSSTSTAHRDASASTDPARPDIVLYNGGVFESRILRDRLLEVISGWFPGEASDGTHWQPQLLDNDRLDLAVARGAAYYGMVRRGAGVRIAASLARSYYLGVAGESPTAVCIVPGNTEPGDEVDLSGCRFDLLVSQPAEFPLYVSSIRLADRPGALVGVDPDQLTSLPPIRTVLRTRRRGDSGSVPVELHARLTEIGTLDLWCSELSGDRSWRLQFDVRATTQTDRESHVPVAEQAGFVDETVWQACQQVLTDTFGPAGVAKPDSLMKVLTEASTTERAQWPPSLLRRMWESAMELEAGRRKSAAHEARWLNLIGYALRPGYGMAVDDWRVSETWRVVQGKLAFGTPAIRNESLILWRRLAGGLTANQQRAIAQPLLPNLRQLHQRFVVGQSRPADVGLAMHELAEVARLLGSLELLGLEVKAELGRLLSDLVTRRKLEAVRPALRWAVGRLGQRVPVHGPLNTIVPPETAAEWLKALMATDEVDAMNQFAITQLARRTDDRYRDISPGVRTQTVKWLQAQSAPGHWIDLVERGGELNQQEQEQLFGESLPTGLRLA